jgi:hypothetical protein
MGGNDGGGTSSATNWSPGHRNRCPGPRYFELEPCFDLERKSLPMNPSCHNYDCNNHSCHDKPGWFEVTTGRLGVMPIGFGATVNAVNRRHLSHYRVPPAG